TLEMVNFPACEVGTAHLPFFTLAVRFKNECALACTGQYAYLAHPSLLISSIDKIHEPAPQSPGACCDRRPTLLSWCLGPYAAFFSWACICLKNSRMAATCPGDRLSIHFSYRCAAFSRFAQKPL